MIKISSISGKSTIDFFCEEDDFSGVKKIADKVRNDIKLVTGTLPEMKQSLDGCGEYAVIFGTVTKSEKFARLAEKAGVDVNALCGKREVYSFTVVDSAFEENKNNGVGPWAFYNYLMCKPLTLPQLEAELANVPSSYMEQKRVKSAIANVKAQAVTAEGQMFTDFTVTREDGSTVKLSDYVGKGTYTLVDFWASWCGPCRREIPNIKALYEKYNGKGMSFLGVAVWDAPADTHKAIEQLQMPWPVIVGNKNLTEPTQKYGIMGIPHIIIFDPEGRIISRGLQGKKLAEMVDACMAK